MLHARGIDASILDSIPLLIGMVALSQLPAGPSVGAAAALLILGTDGVATASYPHKFGSGSPRPSSQAAATSSGSGRCREGEHWLI